MVNIQFFPSKCQNESDYAKKEKINRMKWIPRSNFDKILIILPTHSGIDFNFFKDSSRLARETLSGYVIDRFEIYWRLLPAFPLLDSFETLQNFSTLND